MSGKGLARARILVKGFGSMKPLFSLALLTLAGRLAKGPL